MSSVSDEAPDSKQRLNWLLLLTLACVAAAASMAFEMWAASDKSIGGQVLIWVIASAFVLKAIGLLGRWLLTKSRGRIFLLGRLPFAIGFTKLTALAVMAILILFLVLGLVAGPPYRETALRAFVLA